MATGEILDREKICGAQYTDYEVAGKVRMLGRNDLDHEVVCTIARDRIMWQSQEIERLRMLARAAGVDLPGDEKPPYPLWEWCGSRGYFFQKDLNTVYFVHASGKDFGQQGAQTLVLKREILFNRWGILNNPLLSRIDFAELDGCYLLGSETGYDMDNIPPILNWIVENAIPWETFNETPYTEVEFIEGFYAQYREVKKDVIA